VNWSCLYSNSIRNWDEAFIEEFKATHIAKSLKPTLKPKLGKECVCPTARPKRQRTKRTKKNTEAITYKD
jgi:hypothetical protein